MILSIASLNLLMGSLLHLALEDSRSCWLVEARGFQDVGCVDPVIMAPAHDMFFEIMAKLVFPDRHLKLSKRQQGHRCKEKRRSPKERQGRRLTPLYVALYTPPSGGPLAIFEPDCRASDLVGRMVAGHFVAAK